MPKNAECIFHFTSAPRGRAATVLPRIAAAAASFSNDIQLLVGEGKIFEATRHAEIKRRQPNPAMS